jgi:hypothetical protein
LSTQRPLNTRIFNGSSSAWTSPSAQTAAIAVLLLVVIGIGLVFARRVFGQTARRSLLEG